MTSLHVYVLYTWQLAETFFTKFKNHRNFACYRMVHVVSGKCFELVQSRAEVYTVNHKKTWHFVFDYNYDISWPIFTLFAANETGINTLQWNYTFSKFTLAVSIHYLVKPSVSMKRQIQHETSNFGVSHHNVLLFNNSNESASFLQCLFTGCVQSVHPLHGHTL